MEAVRRSMLPNPRETANPLSVLFFTWTIGLFRRGYKKILELEDLIRPLKSDRSEALGDRLEKKWKRQTEITTEPSLIKAVFQTFWKEYSLLGALVAVNELVVKLSQPYLLGQLLMYFRVNSDTTYEDALWYAGGIVFTNFLSALIGNQFYIEGMHYGMKVRVAVCSIIYRKALRLSQTALGETALGKVVNLLSNDVSRFDLVTLFLHYMWISPVMCVIITYLLWMEVQWAGIIGLIIIFIVVPLQSYTGKLSSIFRYQTALRTDERVRFMDEIISGVQVIKFYAWELPFSKLVAYARKMELKIVRKNSYVRALYMTFLLFTTRTGVFCTMLAIALLYGSDEITASKVFVVSSYFNMVAMSMSQFFVRGVAEIAESLVGMRRLRKFLMYEERKEYMIEESKKTEENSATEKKISLDKDLPDDCAVLMNNVTARWIPLPQNIDTTSESDSKTDNTGRNWKSPTLENINLQLNKGLLIGVVGPVGAGKSSFLQALLRELPLESGSMSLSGSVSYASQVPWIFAGSVRQNILFGQDMDRHRFEAVVKVCDLTKDFEQLAHGEKTIIGDRGASLSGGQKARINLARAVYREADIYLLDDPLSAVDAHVGRHLFKRCIGPQGRLAQQGATRILVTHQVHFLKEADVIIVLRDGRLEVVGSPNELAQSGIDIATLLESDSADPDHNNKRVSLSHSIASSIDQDEEDESKINEKSAEKLQDLEMSSKGKVKGSVGLAYLKSGGSYFVIFTVVLLFLLSQIIASTADYWVSFWTSQEELRHTTERRISKRSLNVTNSDVFIDRVPNHPSIFRIDDDGLLSTELCMAIHGTLVALLFIVSIIRSIAFYSVCVHASQRLHDNMFKGIISTTMRFFDTNPSGRILNRFSKDMGATDELLPKAILDATQVILNMTGAVVISAIVNPYFLIPVAILGGIFMLIRKIYLKTSKNVKRLEGICRSPVFTHIASSLNGLPTIRAFAAQDVLIEEFDNHQDLHSGAWYMFIATSTAFGLVLDLMCVVFVCVITFFFLVLDDDVMGGNVGLAITQVLSLTGMLQWGVRQSAEVANQMMSVERILEYRDLKEEPEPKKPLSVDKSWPQEGKVDFQDVYYKYFDEAEPVLRGLSFSVRPSEKVGIVGRTGAGKSSLIGALFRMALVDGKVIIDGIDTSDVKLSDLRSNVSIIPQDPVLFSGTLRRNLDPFEEYSDDAIWKALGEVELKDIATSHLGLQSAVMAGGSNFSVGQRQLLCLARAILRNNRILVLDEATANVDPHTDTLIQQTIREKFARCTVLTVAHRLVTIMDSDAVLVMDSGKAVEYAAPYELLQMPKGIFRDMVHSLGPHETERLTQIAYEKYRSSVKIS